MDRTLSVTVVDKTDNSLLTLWNDKGRAWRCSVVPYQASRLQVGVNLLGKRLNLKLVVPDVFPGHWILDFALPVSAT